MNLDRVVYPPIVDEITASTVLGNNLKIYFNLSAYNTIEDIRADLILVTVMDISNNESVVNVLKNNGSTQVITGLINSNLDDSYEYCVEIPYYLLNLKSNNTYKIQLRLCSSDYKDEVETANQIDNNFLSEYSDITVVKIISMPYLDIQNFPKIKIIGEYILFSLIMTIRGHLSFSDKQESDYLNSYSIKIFENKDSMASTSDFEFYDSGILFSSPNQINTINHAIKKNFSNGKHYLMQIEYTTNSGFTQKNKYHFTIDVDESIICPPPFVDTFLNKDKGSIKVKIYHPQILVRTYLQDIRNNTFNGYIVLRRTDNTSNFTIWENIKYIKHNQGSIINYTVEDYTVQAGKVYRYQALPLKEDGNFGSWGVRDTTSEVEHSLP